MANPKAKEGSERRTALLKKGVFWKPTTSGERVRGKFVGVGTSEFGKVFKIMTSNNLVVVPASTVLADLDLSEYKGQVVEFTYEGELTGKNGRAYKNYSVDLIEDDEVTPF